jgi:hypothetical protein
MLYSRPQNKLWFIVVCMCKVCVLRHENECYTAEELLTSCTLVIITVKLRAASSVRVDSMIIIVSKHCADNAESTEHYSRHGGLHAEDTGRPTYTY